MSKVLKNSLFPNRKLDGEFMSFAVDLLMHIDAFDSSALRARSHFLRSISEFH